MKRTAVLLALLFLLAAAPALPADESPEMQRQFINALRSRGYARWAIEYLERLSATPEKLDAELRLLLPLEIARTRMSLAEERPLEQREALYDRARTELEKFKKDHDGRPEAVHAQLEIARIAAFQGKGQMSKAVRQPRLAARKQAAGQARQKFEDASVLLKDAVVKLDAQMAKYAGAAKDEDKETLERLKKAKLQAEFDLALNILLQAQTYILDPVAATKQSELAGQAEKLLGEISGRDEKDPLRWKAKAWLIACGLTMTQPDTALDAYKDINQADPDDANLDGKILADYFHLALVMGGKVKQIGKPKGKKKRPASAGVNLNEQVRKEGTEWLKSKDLTAFGNTPDGYGIWIKFGDDFCFVPATPADVKNAVRYTVARACVTEAADATKKKNIKKANELYKQAQDLLEELEQTENDLSPRARQLDMQVFIARRGGKIDIDQIKTFKEFYFLSQYEIGQYRQAKTTKEKKKQLHKIADALSRALAISDDRVPPKDQLKASADLVDVLLNLGDFHRAVILGERLARTHTDTEEGARAAAYALQAYSRILARDDDLARNHAGEGVLTEDVVKDVTASDRERYRQWAYFIISQPAWQNDDVCQYTRYQLAMMALRGEDMVEAIRMLDSIQHGWSGYHMARLQMVFTRMRLTRDDAARKESGKVLGFDVRWRVPLTDKEKLANQELALKDIQALPALTGSPSPTIFRYHFAAQLERCRILYKQKKYADLQKASTEVLAKFASMEATQTKLDAQIKDDLRLGLTTWGEYAQVGLAEQASRGGDYTGALLRLTPLVVDIQGKVAKGEPGSIRNFQMARDILELALLANVQKKRFTEAGQVLDTLKKIASDTQLTGGPTGINPTGIEVGLLLRLKGQIDDLRRQGRPAEAKFNEAVVNFSAFLGQRTKERTTEIVVLKTQFDDLADKVKAAAGKNGKKAVEQQAAELKKKAAQVAKVDGLLARSYALLDLTKQLEAQARLLEEMDQGDEDKGKGKGVELTQKVGDLRQKLLGLQQVVGLLARSYASLEKHKLAAQMIGMVSAAATPTPEEVKNHVELQLIYAQELRKDKQFKKALAVVEPLLNPKKPPATKSLDMIILMLKVKKEQVLIVEGKGDYRSAVSGWTRYMKDGTLGGLLSDVNFKRMLARFKESDRKAMEKKFDKALADLRLLEEGPLADLRKTYHGQAREAMVKNLLENLPKFIRDEKMRDPLEKQVRATEGVYRGNETRTKARLEKMYQDVLLIFADSWYHKTYCIYQFAQKHPTTRAKNVKYAALHIANFETKFPEAWELTRQQFIDLMNAEPELKAQYEELKKAAPKGAG